MTTAARIRIALITLVCAAVFYTSFRHITEVAHRYGNSLDVAALYPICIDAVILISALTLVARTGVSKAARFYAKLGRVFGFAATIFCNLASSDFSSTVAALVALIPAVSLILTVELLIHAAQGTAATRSRSAAKKTTAARKAATVTPLRKRA